jgi:gliding motility-associated-like protein
MKKILILSILFLAFLTISYAQNYPMVNHNGETINSCSADVSLGSYAVGTTYTMTICSDDPLDRHVQVFVNSYSFPNGTSLCVYDGPSDASPLLVCWDHTTTSGTVAAQAQNINESGCLTLVFNSTTTGASFTGVISCNFVCQPRTVDIVAADPPIGGDGYIDVCWDEENEEAFPITFTAQGNYPSAAYPLDDSNVTFSWNFQDGSPIVEGVGLTEVTHTYPNRQGYTVIVTTTDSQGCENTNAVTQRVRISQAPEWNNVTVNPDAICMGEEVEMCGYYSSTDWVSSVVPAIADTVYLPDGSGVCYESDLMQNQFEPGQVLESIDDLNSICMNLVHSYIGDLTMFIQCPNGQTVQMQQQQGGGTNLGEPTLNVGVPGVGYWYCITDDAPQTMGQAAFGTTLPAGDYASFQPLSGLLGCPLNGLWTIRICDNWAIDEGFIFGWYIDFDESLFPEIWGYTTTYSPTSWDGLYGSQIDPPGNTNCATGTYTTTGTPDVNSTQPFIFTITDNFGCDHQTSVEVLVYEQNDPNCCILPNPSAGSDDEICSLTYQLNASALTPENNGFWTMVSGPGTATFTDPNNPTTNVSVMPFGTYVFEWTEQYLGNEGCANSATVTIIFNESFDPTLTPVSDVCISAPAFQIQAVDYGNITCSAPEAFNATTNTFTPSMVNNPGLITITNTIFDPCTGIDQESIINFNVFDEIQVTGFTDQVCHPGTPYTFEVEFTVLNYAGDPTTNYLINGVPGTNSDYFELIESPSYYDYIIEDPNGCSSVTIEGYRDCGCPLYAGTMGSTQLQIICQGECTGDYVTHNGNQETDVGAIFEFMLHAGDNIPIVYNDIPDFCSHQIPGFNYNTIYYVTAIIGFDNGSGHPNITPPACASIAVSTPVMWLENPIAHAGPNKDTCGLYIQLEGNMPEPGMYGYWTSDCDFVTIGGTSYNDPNPIVMSTSGYADCNFYWNIANGHCVANDNTFIRFLQTPSPYAGDDQVVCGNCAELEAIPSVGGNMSWAGTGAHFTNPNSAETTVCVQNYGTYQLFARENNGACFGEDYTLVTFVEEPRPTIPNPVDTVCGNNYNLSVLNVNGTGQWTAYVDGVILSPAPTYSPSINSPNAYVTIGNYNGTSREVEFVWTETIQSAGLQCQATATQTVVFAKSPEASVGAIDEAEICGNEFIFNADTTGSGWATGTWICKDVIHDFDNANDPYATVTIDNLGSFGDSAHVRVPFLWVMSNLACSSVDTMWVTFYKRPVANAGLDNAICGNNYELGAVYNLPASPNYNPEGIWSVHTKPNPSASANLDPTNNDTINVTVSHYGQWVFQFRENNDLLTSCYSVDTVRIEFVENPVVFAGDDKHVCGTCTDMEAVSSGFAGSWLPIGQSFPNGDFDNPTAYICVSGYGPQVFTWQESNQAETTTLSCSSTDDVEITFWRVPQANILTDEADSTTCGLTFNNLRAQNPGSGLEGCWWNDTDPDAVYGEACHWNTNVTVATYGYHDFYWVVTNGPTFQPDFCVDSAGPLRIHFIEIPTANAGGDTLFCGLTGSLNAIPSVGTGVWSTPSGLVSFEDQNDPNTAINSQVLNTGNATHPYFNLIWTEDNTNGCTDKDTIKVIFARIPNSAFNIVPPKCFGEPATLSAQEDSLQQYQWNFYTGVIDSTVNNPEFNANYEHFVYWNSQDTSHRVTLIVTNHWGCNSAITIDTVYEPPIPDFDVIIVQDTCLLGRGGIIFEDTIGTNAFYWIDSTVGPNPGTPITAVYNLPEGYYDIRARYRTTNQDWYNYYLTVFGNAMCTDTVTYNIEAIGLLEAAFDVPLDILMGDLVAPEAEVTFINNSDYGGVRRRCIWNFDDGTTMTSCDDQVIHTYTEAGCYYPFLIVMNRDLQECRDTAKVDVCIEIDNASSLEIPNIFTPNGDGVNDFFQVKAETLREFNGYVVNRWGKVIYEWTNWQDEEAGWDGKLSGGTKASPGVYFYIIKAIGMDDEPYDEHGSFHLMR